MALLDWPKLEPPCISYVEQPLSTYKYHGKSRTTCYKCWIQNYQNRFPSKSCFSVSWPLFKCFTFNLARPLTVGTSTPLVCSRLLLIWTQVHNYGIRSSLMSRVCMWYHGRSFPVRCLRCYFSSGEPFRRSFRKRLTPRYRVENVS